MDLESRVRYNYPCTYKSFRLVRRFGRLFGIPDFLGPIDDHNEGSLSAHPASLGASTREELEGLIDAYDFCSARPVQVGREDGHDLYSHRGVFYGVPLAAGAIDLNLEEERRRTGVICGHDLQQVRERIRAAQTCVPVEFAGWLPIYEASGNCGRHPQFKHTGDPPPGYRFTQSAPRRRTGPSFWQRGNRLVGRVVTGVMAALWFMSRPLFGFFRCGHGYVQGFAPRAKLRALAALLRLFFQLVWKGARLGAIVRFLRSRHYQSQVLLGNHRGLVFLTSMPYTYGQNPWVIEVEDPTTLFYPLIQNGNTAGMSIAESPYYPIVKSLLEAESCKAIITHMKSTATMIPTLFGSEIIRKKVFYTPLGIKPPRRWQRHEESEHINLVFINSWCQVPENFFVRGGLDVLEAFGILHERYPQLRLTLRTNLPTLDEHYHRILEAGWVRIINRFLAPEEMDALLADSHIFLLPAARVHIVSILQAMSYGLAVVTSDGWGIEEYINHERNGLIVKGRYGKISWADDEAGMLREFYSPMGTPDPEVVQGIVEAVSRLVEDATLRKRLGRSARRDVETVYTLDRWNQGVKRALDAASVPADAVNPFDPVSLEWMGSHHGPQPDLLPDRADAPTPSWAPAASGEPEIHHEPCRGS